MIPISIKAFIKKKINFNNEVQQEIQVITTPEKKCKIIDIEPEYCKEAPSNQTILDIFKGIWYTCLPEEYGTRAEPGQIHHYDFSVEERPKWASETKKGGFKDCSILELGPFEAYNAWQLEKLGAKEVVSVEANNISFLKCLMVKEITGIKAKFLHGDIVQYLANCKRRFDVVYASGVLYHMEEPLRMLSLSANIADTIFIWTQYYDEERIHNSHVNVFFTSKKTQTVKMDGYKCTIYYREYNQVKGAAFSGGAEPFSYWMKKEDILGYLKHRGFNKITIKLDEPDYMNGPIICFLAER